VPIQPLTPEHIARLTRAGAWIERPLHHAFDEAAARTPAMLAVADQHERLTYAELRERSINLAAWLLEQELSPGASVGLQCGNRVALAITHLACDRADLTFIPLSVSWRRSELAHLLALARLEVLVVGPPVRDFDPLSSWLVLLRGLVLLGLLAALTWPATERAPARSPSPVPSPGRT